MMNTVWYEIGSEVEDAVLLRSRSEESIISFLFWLGFVVKISFMLIAFLRLIEQEFKQQREKSMWTETPRVPRGCTSAMKKMKWRKNVGKPGIDLGGGRKRCCRVRTVL